MRAMPPPIKAPANIPACGQPFFDGESGMDDGSGAPVGVFAEETGGVEDDDVGDSVGVEAARVLVTVIGVTVAVSAEGVIIDVIT